MHFCGLMWWNLHVFVGLLVQLSNEMKMWIFAKKLGRKIGKCKLQFNQRGIKGIKVGAINAPISRQKARNLQVSSGVARQNANQQVEEMISSRIPLTGSRVADPRCDPRASASRIYLADPQKVTAASCSRIPVFQLTSSSIFRRISMKAAWRILWSWRNNS